jgi:RimJ/RimL family protein N-acetyltransferase
VLEIVALTREQADALLAGPDAFATQYGWTVVDGYLDFPEVLPRVREELARGADPQWGSHLFVETDSAEVVGFGGFKGPPRDGQVEIGYSIAPSRRRRGHARKAAERMIEAAVAAGVTSVVAHTRPEPNPSNRLLQRLGFGFAGEHVDPDDGPIWRWELSVDERARNSH